MSKSELQNRMAKRALSLILDDHAISQFIAEEVRYKLRRPRNSENDEVWATAKKMETASLLSAVYSPLILNDAPEPDQELLLNQVASIICETTCGLTSECKSREAAKALFDKGYLRALKAPNDRSASEQAHEANYIDQEAKLLLKKYFQEFLLARNITLEDHHASALAEALVQFLPHEMIREFIKDKL